MTNLDSLAKIFLESIKDYLDAVSPEYIQGKHFSMREHEIQAFYMARLISEKTEVRMEGCYPPSCDQKEKRRYDLLVDKSLYIEIEWDATWTDCFRSRTFDDLKKLSKYTPDGDSGMFLAVNISDKYNIFPEDMICANNPRDLPFRSPNKNALIRAWESEDEDLLLMQKCTSKFWYWKYPHEKRDYNVLVIACYGKKDPENGWIIK